MLYADARHFGEAFSGNPLLRLAIDFIVNKAPGLEDGRHALPDGMHARVMRYVPGPPAAGRYETHVKYMDLQAVLRGEELLLCHPLVEAMTVVEDRLAEEDNRFHAEPPPGSAITLRLRPGMLALLTPMDAHRTECLVPGGRVGKCVVKIPADAMRF